jgi:hypothetical protein
MKDQQLEINLALNLLHKETEINNSNRKLSRSIKQELKGQQMHFLLTQ